MRSHPVLDQLKSMQVRSLISRSIAIDPISRSGDGIIADTKKSYFVNLSALQHKQAPKARREAARFWGLKTR